MTLQHFVVPCPLFSFLIFYTVGRTPSTGDQPVARPLPTHRTIQTQNKRTQTSMPQMGFEPTIPAFERAKMVLALDRATTVIDPTTDYLLQILIMPCTCFKLTDIDGIWYDRYASGGHSRQRTAVMSQVGWPTCIQIYCNAYMLIIESRLNSSSEPPAPPSTT
jgi:hypothetical protein